MKYRTITYQIKDEIGFITLNRNEYANAINLIMINEILKVLHETGNHSIRALVIEHTSEFFSAGLDLENTVELTGSQIEELSNRFLELIHAISSAPVPVIATVDGKIMGGATGVVAACDLVLITENASFSLPEVMSGMIPALILPTLLNRIPAGKLQALGVGSFEIRGKELIDCGFADRFSNNLQALLSDQLKRIKRSQPQAIRTFKEVLKKIDDSHSEEMTSIAQNALHSWLKRDQQLDIIKSIASGEVPFWNNTLEKYGVSDD